MHNTNFPAHTHTHTRMHACTHTHTVTHMYAYQHTHTHRVFTKRAILIQMLSLINVVPVRFIFSDLIWAILLYENPLTVIKWSVPWKWPHFKFDWPKMSKGSFQHFCCVKLLPRQVAWKKEKKSHNGQCLQSCQHSHTDKAASFDWLHVYCLPFLCAS